jgi:hypothetical protein
VLVRLKAETKTQALVVYQKIQAVKETTDSNPIDSHEQLSVLSQKQEVTRSNVRILKAIGAEAEKRIII